MLKLAWIREGSCSRASAVYALAFCTLFSSTFTACIKRSSGRANFRNMGVVGNATQLECACCSSFEERRTDVSCTCT